MKFGLLLGNEYLARRPMTARFEAILEHVRTARELGFNYCILDYHWIDLDDSIALDTLRRFGSEVLPRFR